MPSSPTDPPEGPGTRPAPTHSVVVPVYKNSATLPALVAQLEALADTLPGPLEAVFVVDGSPDDSADVLARLLPGARIPARLVSHSRNFGALAAIRTGLAEATGDYIGVIAADLQEPPTLLGEFFAALRDGAQVVVGRRIARGDPALSATLARAYWSLYRRWVMPEIPPGGVDVFAVDRQVRGELLRLDESHSSLLGLLFWVGFRRAEVPYTRLARTEGTSSWTLRKKVRYLLDSVFSFTDLPIRLLTTVGAVGVVVTAVLGIVELIARLTGAITLTGYTPIMLAVLGSTFLLLFGLGVVGSYVWRIYENTKGRPDAIVAAVARYHGRGGTEGRDG